MENKEDFAAVFHCSNQGEQEKDERLSQTARLARPVLSCGGNACTAQSITAEGHRGGMSPYVVQVLPRLYLRAPATDQFMTAQSNDSTSTETLHKPTSKF